MAEFKLTNITSAVIQLTDVGLVLQIGESRAIPEELYKSSKDVQTYSSWLQIERIKETPPKIKSVVLPETPKFEAPPKIQIPTSLVQTLTPILPAQSIPTIESNELRNELSKLTQKIAELIGTINAKSQDQNDSVSHVGKVTREAPASLPPDPVYIPSRITPINSEGHIKSQFDESDKSDFDNVSDALKKARRKLK